MLAVNVKEAVVLLMVSYISVSFLPSVCEGRLELPDEPNVLTPPYINIATGKKIESTATCGEVNSQVFCKLTGGPNEYGYREKLHQGQFCDVCDARDPSKSHSINYAIDGTEKWWQSPSLSQGTEYNEVNITIHLGQVFHVAYTIIKFANSPRAGTWVLEHSSDYGKTFQPWQYFASSDSDCHNLFGIDALRDITADDSTICTSEYSDVVPLERGEVIVSMINRRPGANSFSHSPILQEWTKATDIRIRLLRTNTLLGHLMAIQRQDPTVTRRYYYSIKDISIGGRCVCNGHADACMSDPENKYKSKCVCRHHTCGDSCEYCCSGYAQKAWRAAVPESANECEECNCYGHSTDCLYDEDVEIRRLSIDVHGDYNGGGVCQNCSHNTVGINCEKCMDGYYRLAETDLRDPKGCRPCNCGTTFTVGTCEAITGRCYCKPKYAGDKCNRCAQGFTNFPECQPCACFHNGTRNGVCIAGEDGCPCKNNFAGTYCNECASGFYGFPDCVACACSGQGTASEYCDQITGQCICNQGFGGISCEQCSVGFYSYPVCRRCSCVISHSTTAQICNATTGTCFCADFITGESCNQCVQGYFEFPFCRECDCSPEGSLSNACDADTGKCKCKPNYQGLNCKECVPDFYGYPECIPCNCDVHGSVRNACDAETGKCSCSNNFTGRRCHRCTPYHFNFPTCENCRCNPMGIKTIVQGECLAFTTGQCDCKENVSGTYCDKCDSMHYDLSQGCLDCGCFIQGTLDGIAACDSENGACPCKMFTDTRSCAQCGNGFYKLGNANYLGCDGCQCNTGGAYDGNCDSINGQCRCKDGIAGRRCNSVEEGRYYPTLLQYQFEVEDGKTMSGNIVRFGFDELTFAGYSGKGYGEFSIAQTHIIVPVTIPRHGLYRSYFHYIQPRGRSTVNVTFSPVNGEGVVQSFQGKFGETATSKVFALPDVMVLTDGEWDVIINGEPGLLIDFFLLLPSEYYEPSMLQAKVVAPCRPEKTMGENECMMYTHFDIINIGSCVNLSEEVDETRLITLSGSHPNMVVLDGNSIKGYDELRLTIIVDNPGEYVLVLEYASKFEFMQTVDVAVFSGGASSKTKFNIYSCYYAFLCRQVGLTINNEVMIHNIVETAIQIELKIAPRELIYITRLYAIPHNRWDMEYVEPKRRCIVVDHSRFEDCFAWTYPMPDTGRKFKALSVQSTSVVSMPSATAIEAEFINGDTSIQITMDLISGKNYAFLLHYYNPNHLSFYPSIVFAAGMTFEGGANITYCPAEDGCRAVFNSGDMVLLDVSVPKQTMTITLPQGVSLWLDYVLAVPENSYESRLLNLMSYDNSGRFFKECYGAGNERLLDEARNPSEFCKSSVFTLTTHFNGGALICQCDKLGTVSGLNADCEAYGGQCSCRPNVVGRRCEQCALGYYGFPDCTACKCNGTLCDTNGDCICPPNTLQPDCLSCAPFMHSYHPLAGCVACECNIEGVKDPEDLRCSEETGQCRCKDSVEGPKCDRCSPGHFNFPKCRPCICSEQGIVSPGCDPVSGQCLCKENVEGQQCDRCKSGSFHLDGRNELGCTACFCFGVSKNCSGTLFPKFEITHMRGWKLMYSDSSTLEPVVEGHTASVEFGNSETCKNKNQENLYWTAPSEYLGDKLGSYGAELRFTTNSLNQKTACLDDDAESSAKHSQLHSSSPSLMLEGNGFLIRWTNCEAGGSHSNSVVGLKETNFVHQMTGDPVTREDLMSVLSGLSSLRIRASHHRQATFVSISNVSLTTTDYHGEVGMSVTIPTVEECLCPKGYSGGSCQLCSLGHYRELQGPYLGFCAECDCHGHCHRCDVNGFANKDDCLHNTIGKRCENCRDGFVGDAASRDPDACLQCPCPYALAEGNFAEKCFYNDTILVCHCKPGYRGTRCDECDLGYYGNPSVLGGTCLLCNCHGNVEMTLDVEQCDTVTGECFDCKFNTGGRYCDKCAKGYYGDATIPGNCSICSCNECGTSRCTDQTGSCVCKPHVLGKNCNRCEFGFYDFSSCAGCHACNCDIASKGDDCNEYTGKCTCAPNVVGLKCDMCNQGHWNYSSTGCQPCNCHNNGDCNTANGECWCPQGVTGRQCNKCKMDRHILPPDGVLCEPCDDCTHVLLDDVEADVEKRRKTGLGVLEEFLSLYVHNKLHAEQNRLKRVKMIIEGMGSQIDRVIFDGERLLEYHITTDPGEIGSGSGYEEASGYTLGSTFYVKVKIDSLYSLLNDLKKVDRVVSTMCNHTESMLETMTKTSRKLNTRTADYTPISESIKQIEAKFHHLLEKSTTESSGDDFEYSKRFAKLHMTLERLKQRNMFLPRNSANFELVETEDVLHSVTRHFTSLSRELGGKTAHFDQDLATKAGKMRAMRNSLTIAIGIVMEAKGLNSMNRRRLQLAQRTFFGVKSTHTRVCEVMLDSEKLLSSNSTSLIPTLDEADFLAEVEKLTLMLAVRSYGIDMNETIDVLSKASDKAVMLGNKSQMLAGLIRLLTSDSKISSALAATSRYAVISGALEMAESFGKAFEPARDELQREHFSDLVANNSSFSADLLYDFQALDSKLLKGQNKLKMIKKHARHMRLLIADLFHRLNLSSVSNGFINLSTDREHIATKVRNASRKAVLVVNKVIRRTNALQSKMSETPETKAVHDETVTAIEGYLENLPNVSDRVHDRAAKLTGRISSTDILARADALNGKMKMIRKLIELSRSSADNVKVAMKFNGDDSLDTSSSFPAYVQPRVPAHMTNLQEYIKLELDFNASIAQNSSILFLGDISSGDGDYISLETRMGKVHFNYKCGDHEEELVSHVQINDNEWHHIVIQRTGVRGTLEVQLGNPDGEGIFNEVSYEYDSVNSEDRYSTSFVSSMPLESTVFILGRMPLPTLPSAVQNQQMSGCVRDVFLNGEAVSIWNFVSYSGPQPGLSCRNSSPDIRERMWSFRGYDSYLRASAEQLRGQAFIIGPRSRNSIIQFKFQTIQSDALLFLYGRTEKQFFALEIINGKFVMTCNFGWNKPKQAVATDFPDVNTQQQPLAIKSGIVQIGRTRRMAVLAINSVLKLNITFSDWAPDLREDGWVGGVHRYERPHELRKHLKTIDQHFHGCLGYLAFHYRIEFNMYSASEKMGITPGCHPELITTVGFHGNDYISVPSALVDLQEIDGLVVICTENENGTIVLAKERKNANKFVLLSILGGYVVLTDGSIKIRSDRTYNDGTSHTIKFNRYTDGRLRLAIDKSFSREEEPLYRVVRRKKRRVRLREGIVKSSLFSKSEVHLFIGGHSNGAHFSGCIGSILIDGPTNTNRPLTEGVRCGFNGNIRCFGNPKFNGCSVGSNKKITSAEINSRVFSTATNAGNEEVSAFDLANSKALSFNGEIDEHAELEERAVQRNRRQGRGGGRNRSRTRVTDNLLGTDAALRYDNLYDRACQLPLLPGTTGWNYTGLGYSEYSVDNFNPDSWKFSLTMRTVEREGIIFFISPTRDPGLQEHVAVYLVGGKITLSVRFGGRRIRIKSYKKYNDGFWHDITFQLKASKLQIIIDDVTRSEIFEETSFTFPILVLFYVGGLQKTKMEYASSFISRSNIANFQGCIQNLAVNDQFVEVSNTARLLLKINVNFCFKSKTEEGIFFSTSDEHENGAYMMVYNTYNVETNLDVSMQIRPRVQTGVLVAVGGQTGNFFQLSLIDGKVVARLKQGSDILMSMYDPSDYNEELCDGMWHKIHVIKAKNVLTLSVDGNTVTPIEQGKIDIRSCETDGPLFIGGLPVDANVGETLSSRRQYTGCMKEIRIDHFRIDFDTPVEVTKGVSGNACPIY